MHKKHIQSVYLQGILDFSTTSFVQVPADTIFCTAFNLPIEMGIIPDNELLFKNKNNNAVKLPIDDGIVPDN